MLRQQSSDAASNGPSVASRASSSSRTPASADVRSPLPTDAAVARLYRSHAPAVARWARHLMGSRSEAEDIVHEVFLVVHRRADELPHLRSPGAWLFRITGNVVRHGWRDRHRLALTRARCREQIEEPRPSPLDELERRTRLAQLDAALGSVSARDRRLLWLGDVRCLPTSRLSAITGLNPQTLRVQRFRARLRVARQLHELDRA